MQKMLAEYQAQNNVPQEVCDQILEAAKESSVGEDGVRSQVKIRKPKGKNNIRYEYDLDHIDCERNEITFYRHINHSDGSRHEVQYVVGIEKFINAHVFNSEKVGGEEGCTIFTEDLVLNKAKYKENSELNMSDYELTEKNKAKIDECLKGRQKAMDARTGEAGCNAQIAKINQQSAKIGEMSKNERGTTEWEAATEIKLALKRGRPIRYIHTQTAIYDAGQVSKVKGKEFKIDLGEL